MDGACIFWETPSLCLSPPKEWMIMDDQHIFWSMRSLENIKLLEAIMHVFFPLHPCRNHAPLLNPEWTPLDFPGRAGHHTFWRILSMKRTNLLFLSSRDGRMRNIQLLLTNVSNSGNSSPCILQYKTYPENFEDPPILTPSRYFSDFQTIKNVSTTSLIHFESTSIATNSHSNRLSLHVDQTTYGCFQK